MNLLENFRQIKNQLNNISFAGFKDLQIGDASGVALYDCFLLVEKTRIIKNFILRLFFVDYEYKLEINNNAKILFLLSPSIAERPEHINAFRNIIVLAPNQDSIISQRTTKRFQLKQCINILYLPIWLWQMSTVKLSITKKLHIISYMLTCKNFISYLNKSVDVMRYNALITYCDIHPCDNIATQLFKLKGIHTATLQHGVFTANDNTANLISDIDLGYEHMISDHMLVWSEAAKHEGILAGIPENKFFIMGPVKYVHLPKPASKLKTNTFAVVLAGFFPNDCFNKINNEILEIAVELSEHIGMDFKVRAHPSNYSNCTSYCPIAEGRLTEQLEDISSFMDGVDFVLVPLVTTMVIEFLYFEKPIFLHQNSLGISFFREIKSECFHNCEELESMIFNIKENHVIESNYINDLFDKLAYRGNIAKNYADYFEIYAK